KDPPILYIFNFNFKGLGFSDINCAFFTLFNKVMFPVLFTVLIILLFLNSYLIIFFLMLIFKIRPLLSISSAFDLFCNIASVMSLDKNSFSILILNAYFLVI